MADIRELTEIVEQVSTARTFDQAARILVDWAQALAGCEAAMLRMVQPGGPTGGWIPTAIHRGVGARFLQDEALIGAGECLCGQVCSGRPDPSLPFFTAGGSFLCGSVQSMGKELPAEALGELRGRCILDGYDSIAIFPLLDQDTIMGSLHLADHAHEKFSGHANIIEAACRECGRLLSAHYSRERQAAALQAVQAALVPQALPEIPGLELTVAFRSATDMADVGGDFYDAVALESGDVLVLVGDYCGHGIEAAGMAARARSAISRLARVYGDPEELLTRANEALSHILPTGRFVTLTVCRYSGEGKLLAAVAGHPRPLHLERGEAPAEIRLPPNVPLGLDLKGPFLAASTLLSHAPALLLYTDGVTDSRREGEFFGLEGIARVWKDSSSRPVCEFPDALCRESECFHDIRGAQDDRLVLLARFTV